MNNYSGEIIIAVISGFILLILEYTIFTKKDQGKNIVWIRRIVFIGVLLAIVFYLLLLSSPTTPTNYSATKTALANEAIGLDQAEETAVAKDKAVATQKVIEVATLVDQAPQLCSQGIENVANGYSAVVVLLSFSGFLFIVFLISAFLKVFSENRKGSLLLFIFAFIIACAGLGLFGLSFNFSPPLANYLDLQDPSKRPVFIDVCATQFAQSSAITQAAIDTQVAVAKTEIVMTKVSENSFFDDFNDDRNGWTTKSSTDSMTSSISGGRMTLSVDDDYGYHYKTCNNCYMDETIKDYQFDMTFRTSDSDVIVGIAFSCTNENYGCMVLSLNLKEQKYQYIGFGGVELVVIPDPSESYPPIIYVPGRDVKLTLRIVDQQASFYVDNDKTQLNSVYQINRNGGGYFSIYAWPGGGQVLVDSLTVTPIYK